MTLPVSTLINISSTIATGGVPRNAFGRGLLITTNDAIAAGGAGKLQSYSNLAGVTSILSGTALTDAAIWFAADPAPKDLYVGRWASIDISTTLQGDTPSASTTFTGSTYSLSISGTNVMSIDLSTPTTYAGIATAIETAVAAVIAGTTVTYSATDNAFIFTFPDARALEPGYLTAAVDGTGTQIGVDLVPLLAMGATDDVIYRQGHDAETIGAAINEMVSIASSGAPIALMLATDVPLTVGSVDTRTALATYAEAGQYMYALLDTSATELVTAETTSLGALNFGAQRGNVAAIYSETGERPDIGALAALSGQDMSQPEAVINLNAKPLPGVQPSTITETQFAELTRKRVNVYTTVGGTPSFLRGYMGRNGYWMDAVWWLLWAQNRMSNDIWNTQRSARRFNRDQLLDVLSGVMEAGVLNGGIQPGGSVDIATKNDIVQVTGNNEFDGTLSTGSLIWVDPNPSATDVSNRIGRFQVWAVGTETINEVFGTLIFLN